ncbi:MAG TPA: hypothetical protein VIM36_09480 [Gemmatimonadaceae bacterium]|jgi:hypothetical protein
MNPDVVRPGTSDALTARTIDATIYPPLVRAQETAAALVPRLAQAAAPLSSPLLLGALALTLVFSWVAIRMRYRPSALVLGALLVMTLTSFSPVRKPEQPRTADTRIPRTTIGGTRPSHRILVYTRSPQVEGPDIDVKVDPVQVDLPPDFAERLPDWSRDAMQSAARMMRDNERVREVMKEIRYRLREEARRQRWRQMVAEHKGAIALTP